MSVLKQRFLLVSDMHYTTEERPEELKEKYQRLLRTGGVLSGEFQSTPKPKPYNDGKSKHARCKNLTCLLFFAVSVQSYKTR